MSLEAWPLGTETPLHEANVAPQSLQERGINELYVFSRQKNRFSERYASFLARMTDEADKQGVAIFERPTSPSSEGFIRNLRTIQESGDGNNQAYASFAGDGTTNSFLTALRKVGGSQAILFAGGNKNDVPNQTNTKATKRYPERLFRKNVVRWLHPLEVNIETDDETTAVDAFGYFSAGITANIAHQLNDPSFGDNVLHRSKAGQYLHEYLTAAHGILRAPRFITTKNGNPERVAEILIANGRLMAGALKPRAELFKRHARVIEAAHLLGALGIGAALRVGLPIGRDFDGPVEFKLDGPAGVWLQYDGESLWRDSARVSVRLADRPVSILAAR